MLRIGISKVVLDKVVSEMIEDRLEFEEFTCYFQKHNCCVKYYIYATVFLQALLCFMNYLLLH